MEQSDPEGTVNEVNEMEENEMIVLEEFLQKEEWTPETEMRKPGYKRRESIGIPCGKCHGGDDESGHWI